MADKSVPIFMDCSSVWNCASWVRNWVLSAGFSGSWFLIWATRSCRNMSLVTSEVPVVAVVSDELGLDVGSVRAIAEIIGFLYEYIPSPLTSAAIILSTV